MDRDFTFRHKITLENLICPTSIIFIDGGHVASKNIIEECGQIRVVLEELARLISFNLIISRKHSIFLGFPWFELHNPKIIGKTERFMEENKLMHKLRP